MPIIRRLRLRTGIVAIVGVAFGVSFAATTVIAILQARRMVRAELVTELATSAEVAHESLDRLPANPPNALATAPLIDIFNGSRHIVAAFIPAHGQPIIRSRPRSPPLAVPSLFFRAADPAIAPSVIHANRVAPGAIVELIPFPLNEIAERWIEFRARIVVLASFAAGAGLLAFLWVAWGLRPLSRLLQAFTRLAAGERDLVLPVAGAPEIAQLTAGFNGLAASLAAAEETNRKLEARMLDLAAEEREAIARDLHDEIGPLLFSIGTFSGAIEPSHRAGNSDELRRAVAGICDSVATLSRSIRELIGRLSDIELEGEELRTAATRLLAFWQQLQPSIIFRLESDEGAWDLPPQLGAVALRVIGESLSNAVRHGSPDSVRVTLRRNVDWVEVEVEDDGKGGNILPGFGLSAMRERVQAVGGTLGVERCRGWRVMARLPLAPSSETKLGVSPLACTS
jgi:two-component system, NarL family, sensor histidine kinase UhpB